MRATNESAWRRLRLAAAVFAVAALAGGGAASAGRWHEREVLAELKEAEARLAEARRSYSALMDARRHRRRHELAFRRWAANGRIGAGDPEHWERAVRGAAPEVLSASHRTGPPRVVEPNGGVEVRATETSIELRMRHEAELPEYLAALARAAGGSFSATDCRLVRSGPKGTDAPPSALIDASCRLRRKTVHLTGVEPGWLPPAAEGIGDGARGNPPGAAPVRAAIPRGAFGRLFTTVEERARIESAAVARAQRAPPPEVPEDSTVRTVAPPRPPQWVHVNGLVARSGEAVFAWIDGTRVDRGSRPDQPTDLRGIASYGVRLEAGGRWIAVRPGQRLDPATGEVADRIGRNAVRLERARFLPSSSPAPLRESPDAGQN